MTKQEVIQVNTPTQHRNVYSALAAAQKDMDSVRKGSVNPAFKSRYADLADVIHAVMPALNAHGIAMFHSMRRIEGENCVVTILAHGDSDTTIECAVPLIVNKNDMQGMKSATTYAKRIGAESVTGIAPEDDDGNAAVAAAPRRQEAKPPQETTPIADDMSEFVAAISSACVSLEMAQDLNTLKTIFSGLRRDVQADASVIKAKDKRKAELTAIPFDEIPY